MRGDLPWDISLLFFIFIICTIMNDRNGQYPNRYGFIRLKKNKKSFISPNRWHMNDNIHDRTLIQHPLVKSSMNAFKWNLLQRFHFCLTIEAFVLFPFRIQDIVHFFNIQLPQLLFEPCFVKSGSPQIITVNFAVAD